MLSVYGQIIFSVEVYGLLVIALKAQKIVDFIATDLPIILCLPQQNGKSGAQST
jgi:hypothetical protein